MYVILERKLVYILGWSVWIYSTILQGEQAFGILI